MNELRIIIGSIIILIGVGWLFDFNVLRFIIPLILIFLGIQVLMGRNSSLGSDVKEQNIQEDRINDVAIFSGLNKKYQSEQFKGGKLVAVFGGGEVDLRQVKVAGSNIHMEIVAIFGGVKVRIPPDWSVTSEGVGIFGGYNNRAVSTAPEKASLKVTGVAIFGGVDVVN